ncbi:signal peptidase II [Parvibium lacunae]|uniref:Lipoprotein signal peptidase n=1 Tax=Parvibium lacunae TaxID=1888893 RepID=A0A368L4H9_9BURK|nr:signal peptidase II [Parvibium lacunae]RCS58479.1 lipoprotein signal peptidase [Parvibium lacunae]
MAKSKSSFGTWLAISALIILLDQLSKILIVRTFTLHEVKPITSFFNLVLAHNPGAAFSFLANAGGWQRDFFTALGVVVSLIIIWMLYKHSTQRLFAGALALILGGAIGNVIDRIRFGYVIDFLDFYWGNLHWPAFNVADSAICVGAALLVWDEISRVRKAR